MKKLLLLVVIALTSLQLLAQEEARLLRFPAISDKQISFTYAGDLYVVDINGGTARKITSDVGFEMFPKFSPDGSTIAFTGQYDGNTEVYVMQANGGVPKRVTYTATLDRDDVSDRMGPNNIVMTWKNNNEILFRSRKIEHNDWKGQLFLVSKDGSPEKQLPLPRGGFATYSPDGNQLAYNRVFREFRTWKRYRGGQADDVWIYDFNTKETKNITNNPAQDIFPMWHGRKVFFISDRDKRLNLFVYNLDTKETKKLTDFKDYDIKFPSVGTNHIVFENGGYIYKYDVNSDKLEKVTIYLSEDFAVGRGGLIDVSKNVSNFEISPDGNRALFGARGEVFTVPAKQGPTRNLTNTSNAHERNSKWSPDGKWIAYISDKTGEDEIYIIAQDGKNEAQQITSGSKNYKFNIYWSPDSKKILWGDREQKLYYVDVESKKVTEVAKSDLMEFQDYSWSPDSKWIAYSKSEREVMNNVYLYSLENKKTVAVTDGWYTSYNPVFSSSGKYLFLISNRTFNPRYGQTEWNHIYLDMSKIYMVALDKETKSPFEPKSDEVALKTKDTTKTKEEPKKEVVVKVDEDGITQRMIELPIPASNYRDLVSVGERLYYIRTGSSETASKLYMFDLEKKKETELGGISGYEVSADQKKMLLSQGDGYAIIEIPQTEIKVTEKLNLSNLKMNLNRHEEWRQIYNECWRQMRDFFYDPNMHGVDWNYIQKLYEPLVKYVNHRADLTYIIGEVIGELNVGHAYVGGGDYPKSERITLGLLGAKIEQDASTKYYQIKKILKGENWNPALRSPLTEIGVNVKEGDYIIAVDGIPVNKVNNIFELLVGKADKQVTLTINGKASDKGTKDVVVVPISNEQPLYYYNMVQTNIEKVSKATDGKVGYIHIPDMGVNGLNQFIKLYYPQLRKQALIIDDRGNGGGNVSPMITERLNRIPVMIDIARNSSTGWNPGGTHVGPKVLLLDEFSASDGDIFPYRFRASRMGKLIGKRSWGGVVGIRGTLPIVDGGYLNRPEFSRYDIEGKEWIMEGYGVDPDIVVDNDPAKEFEGIDEQLNKALEVIKEELKNFKLKLPETPVYPDKK